MELVNQFVFIRWERQDVLHFTFSPAVIHTLLLRILHIGMIPSGLAISRSAKNECLT